MNDFMIAQGITDKKLDSSQFLEGSVIRDLNMTTDRQISMSLTKKLVLAFLLVTLIPVGVIIWISHRTFVEQAQAQIGAAGHSQARGRLLLRS